MKLLQRVCFFLLFTAAAAGTVFAGFKEKMYNADVLDIEGKYTAEKNFLEDLEKSTEKNKQVAEIYWRLSRTYLQFGEVSKRADKPRDQILALFERGIKYADMAIAKDSENALAYFWKAANEGRWGQVKGILESLEKANQAKDLLYTAISYDPMYPGGYYVLGQLYDQVPGWPIGYGNLNFAVSMARRAVAVNEINLKDGSYPYKYYDMYIELAKYLWKRNWDKGRRLREQVGMKKAYREKSSTLEKYCYYEGVVTLKPESDRQEAMQIMNQCIAELKKMPSLFPFQEKALKKAEKLLAQWH